MERGYLEKQVESLYAQLDNACHACGRDPASVQVLFATKYINVDQLGDVLSYVSQRSMPHIIIGENRVQRAVETFPLVEKRLPHVFKQVQKVLIGTLQKNKITKAITVFDQIHSIESVSTARALSQRLCESGQEMPVYLQVNVSGEHTKQGIAAADADAIIEAVRKLPGMHLNGLMTIAPLVSDPEETRPVFRVLRQVADRHELQTSMGMSNDWRVAVEEGSDMIRIGSALFR